MATNPKNMIYIPGTKIPWMTTKFGGADRHVLNQRISARIEPTSTEAASIRHALTYGIARSLIADTALTLGAIAVAANEALLAGLDDLDRDIKTTPPTVPESPKGGTLRTSWETRPAPRKGYVFRVEAGFNAVDSKNHPYAVYVHEMTDEAYKKKIKWTKPGSGAKFLEKGLQRNADNIVNKVIAKIKALTV